jgi:hypothetical protein
VPASTGWDGGRNARKNELVVGAARNPSGSVDVVASLVSMTLRFCGGGPWDGVELRTQDPAQWEFVLPGGRYVFQWAHPANHGDTDPTAMYQWTPEADTGRTSRPSSPT